MNPSARTRLYPAVMASLTLGLAPFFPEPHVWGKLRWVAGGAVGMQPMDWGDLLMHGAPWVFLAVTLGQVVMESLRTRRTTA